MWNHYLAATPGDNGLGDNSNMYYFDDKTNSIQFKDEMLETRAAKGQELHAQKKSQKEKDISRLESRRQHLSSVVKSFEST